MGTLTSKQRLSVGHIGGLVLVNALVFQEVLAEHNPRVKSIQKILNAGQHTRGFSKQWKFILDNINYYPIFHVAVELLESLTAKPEYSKAIEELATTAQRIVEYRSALRHDLMGRVYHRLLAEAKYLGTYYTSIPAATLLLKLALRNDSLVKDPEAIHEYRAGDLACGTGTLLMAAADAISDACIRANAGRGEDTDLPKLHQILSEKVIHGYDVLPAAIHLTASTLALRAPQVSFKKMNLISLPLGGRHNQLGSIEFLGDRHVSEYTDLFGAVRETGLEQVTSRGSEKLKSATIPQLDLCVMNPPFTRSVGGNLLFGSLPDSQRRKMQKRLSDLLRLKKALASTTAGLGSVFVALADQFIKPGGRLGLVLPKALLSGVAWNKTRQLLRERYRVEFIVASHDPERWNFSENTDLSEVLVIAVKDKRGYKTDGEVVALNLSRNPITTFESIAIQSTLPTKVPLIESSHGATNIRIGDEKVGEALSMRWTILKDMHLWILPAAFAQSELTKVAQGLLSGILSIPGSRGATSLKLCRLRQIGTLGPDRRDIHDCFDVSQSKTAYPTLWGHDSSSMISLSQTTNGFLAPLGKAKPGRSLRKVEDLWPHAGRLVLAERLRLNTQRLIAARLDKKALSNMWWTILLKENKNLARREKALVLWFNSTLGILIHLANREETEGAWVNFKKPTLEELPTISIDTLSAGQLEKLEKAYDELQSEHMSPFPNMASDKVRVAIDNAIAKVLRLPDFSSVRSLLAQEPVVCLNRI